MRKIFKLSLIILLISVALLACEGQTSQINDKTNMNSSESNNMNVNGNQNVENQPTASEDQEDKVDENQEAEGGDIEDSENPISEENDPDTSESKNEEDLTERYKIHGVNEMGQIMVIMYHNLADQEGLYATTPETFKEDLIRLHTSGYRLVNLSDVVNNTIDIPVGTTPIVLTFDDGSKSNFYYDEKGEIAKDSVIGIFNEVKEMYDDFIPKGMFYLNGALPFREEALIGDKLNYLIENGYEIGNHTYGHEKLNTLSSDQIQKTIGKQAHFLESFVEDYEVVHLSIPYGVRPDDDRIDFVFSGSYQEKPYKNISAVNVGWNPVLPFGHEKFNPRSINRITCGFDDFELHYWLDYFEENPQKKYISDGDANTLVVPSIYLDQVDEDYLNDVTVYEIEEEN